MSKMYAHIEPFPSCCGAAILRSFVATNEVSQRSRVDKYLIARNNKSHTLVAITAHYQEETEKLLKKLGFKKKCTWKNYGSKLTLGVLKKATPPKKKRK